MSVRLSKIAHITIFLVFILFTLLFPIVVVYLKLPYDLIDLGIFFPLPFILLNLLYVYDNKLNMKLQLYDKNHYKCFPVQQKFALFFEYKYLITQPRYYLFILASCFLFFYLTIFKSDIFATIIAAFFFLISLVSFLLFMIVIKNKYLKPKILIHLLNLQFVLFFIPFAIDSSSSSWYLSLGNLISYNFLFEFSITHLIIFIGFIFVLYSYLRDYTDD